MYTHAHTYTHTHSIILAPPRQEESSCARPERKIKAPGKAAPDVHGANSWAAPGPRGGWGWVGATVSSLYPPSGSSEQWGTPLTMWVGVWWGSLDPDPPQADSSGLEEEDAESGPDKEDATLPTPTSHPDRPVASAELRERERLGQGPSVLPPCQLGTLGISFHHHLLPFPTICLRPQPRHTPPPAPGWKVLDWDVPRKTVSFLGSWTVPVILTKKSKLKRKRKYLVTLMQADPILSVLELPGQKRDGRSVSAVQDLGWRRTGNRCRWTPQTH